MICVERRHAKHIYTQRHTHASAAEYETHNKDPKSDTEGTKQMHTEERNKQGTQTQQVIKDFAQQVSNSDFGLMQC